MKTPDDTVGRAHSRTVLEAVGNRSFAGALRARLVGKLAPSAFLLTLALVQAYPPAPHHTFFGTVRDERGNPVNADNAEVLFETPNGRFIRSMVTSGIVGQNYQLSIPMDAGATRDLYQPTAMRPMMPYRIQVRIGREVFLPIEIRSTDHSIGRAGRKTQLNLTLGEDLDGDGIPDAWEQSLINRGLADDLASVNPEDDADGDGLSNLLEYMAGSYAFDEESAFELVIKDFKDGVPVMGFMALPGRSYEVLGSSDFNEWESVSFRMTSDEEGVPLREGLYSEGVTEVEIEVPAQESAVEYRFFKLHVN